MLNLVHMMSDLIEEALAKAAGESLDQFDPAYSVDAPAAAVVLRLVRALEKTGPLYHQGRLFRAGEGETYNRFIEVIEDVRLASEVPIPEA